VIPEDLGPEEAMESSDDLVNSSRQDDESCQMVLDESSHFD